MSLRQMTYGLLLLLAAFPAGAQTLRKPLPACDFAHFERNRIVLSSPEAYDRVFAKLDSVLYLGQGNLRILHIGGSHVPAGCGPTCCRCVLRWTAAGGLSSPSAPLVRTIPPRLSPPVRASGRRTRIPLAKAPTGWA